MQVLKVSTFPPSLRKSAHVKVLKLLTPLKGCADLAPHSLDANGAAKRFYGFKGNVGWWYVMNTYGLQRTSAKIHFYEVRTSWE